ncbi:hypothetical protein BRADI_4g35430v3 [Brachypodium distachyon]|uniref:Uncharacterized protein n=1 Tax=Brachypodium distachyon TaxID=15368 RepID=I1IRX7_BRADI|nr:hypothetical protein BRADI_4g35430v3 [Brachypodium distachyon]
MEGIFPFVCAAFRKRRTKTADRYDYERLVVPGAGDARARFDGNGGGRGDCLQSQSCRFPVRRPPTDGLDFSHGGGDDRPPPEDLSGELSPPAGRSGRGGLSRSLRFGSMRVLACIGGP